MLLKAGDQIQIKMNYAKKEGIYNFVTLTHDYNTKTDEFPTVEIELFDWDKKEFVHTEREVIAVKEGREIVLNVPTKENKKIVMIDHEMFLKKYR